MEKLYCSKTGMSIAIFLAPLIIVIGLFILKLEVHDFQWSSVPTIILVILGCISILYTQFFYFLLYFEFNSTEVVMHRMGKRYTHRWSDFVDCGIHVLYYKTGTTIRSHQTVYLSTRVINQNERNYIHRKFRKESSEFVFFEYSEKTFNDTVGHLPSDVQRKLYQELELLADNGGMKPEIIGKPIEYKKKYPISKDGFVFVIIGLVFFLWLQIYLTKSWLLKSIPEDGILTGYTLVILLVLVGVLFCVKWTFFEFHNGTVRMDAEGITIRVGLKKRKHLWKNIVEYDIVMVGFSHTVKSPMFWVYASERPLTPYEKTHFKRLRHDLKELAYFECKPGPFYELLRYIPPEWQDKLREKVT